MAEEGARAPQGPESHPQSRRFPAEALRRFCAAVFAARGLSEADAETAAAALVAADLRGVWSHGVARLPMYCERLARGVARARPAMVLEAVAPAATLLDGDDGLGLVVAPRAMAEAVRLASAQGLGLVGVCRSGHFGMAALYVEQATAAGCLGLAFTNASPALPPCGGSRPFFGTSPLAVAAPVGEGPPFVVDMAMSTVARGKLKFAAQRGEAIPPGLALDPEGRPTTDGAAAFAGTLLPFGGAKGAALAWTLEVLAGVFTGAAFGGEVGNPFTTLDRPQGVGHLFLALRADLFQPAEAFAARMDTLAARAKAQPPAAGFEEILAPGEPEARRAAANAAAGVPLSPDVVASLRETAAAVGVDCFPD